MPWRLLLQTLGKKGRKNPDLKVLLGLKMGKNVRFYLAFLFFVKVGDYYLLASPYLEKSKSFRNRDFLLDKIVFHTPLRFPKNLIYTT